MGRKEESVGRGAFLTDFWRKICEEALMSAMSMLDLREALALEDDSLDHFFKFDGA